jgi:radical SAM superfamily enzyme YgiQ (UPF0313 family)
MKKMRLHIIQPTHYLSPSNRSLHKTKKRSVVNLTLPYLAALVPAGWEITLIDEQLNKIDFDSPVDVVAITTWTMNSIRAYEVADRFRQRGVSVLMGGPHMSFHADEAVEHCDAVCSGEGEVLWPTMLEDAAAGRLKKIYSSEEPHSLRKLRMPRYDLIDMKRYGLFKTFAVQTSRGCPFRCEFCSERLYLGESYRYRPTQDVIEEIKHTGANNILFADSNFAGSMTHTMEIMEALIPLRIRWSALWSAHLCKNEAFMDLAKRSGLLHLNIGMESINPKTLISMNKKANKTSEYGQILAGLRDRGISYSLNFIFGWDTETEDVFSSTFEFLKKNKVPAAYFNILTPDKGTPLYDRMLKENRITNIDDLGRWPGDRCFIKPKNYSAQSLEKNVRFLHNTFYSYPSMLARLPIPVTKGDIASWVINLSQHDVMRGEAKENFDFY